MSSDKIFNIFPTDIFRYNLNRPFSTEEFTLFNNIEKKLNRGNQSSVDQYILNLPMLNSLKLVIEEKVKEYFYTTAEPENNVEIFISQSWLNLTKPGEHHHKHRHSNSYISGVVYIDANIEKDKIYFYDRVYRELFVKPKNHNLWNSDSWHFPVKTGDIILFPSSLEHMVETVETDNQRDVRISLAFNTFLKGTIGNYASSTELVL